MAKFGDEDGAFSLRCAELALDHWPTSIQAMLLKSGSLHKAWQQAADGEKGGLERELTAVCAAIAATGYEPVPQALYWEWLTSSGEEKYRLDAPVQHAKNRAAPDWYTGKVLTLTDGRYEEYHVQPDTLRVGGLLFDVPNGKIVAFGLPEGETLVDAQAVGKFLSVDPLTRQYPMLTPYQFASNTPIMAIDLDGLEAKEVIEDVDDGTGPLPLNGQTAMDLLSGGRSSANDGVGVQPGFEGWYQRKKVYLASRGREVSTGETEEIQRFQYQHRYESWQFNDFPDFQGAYTDANRYEDLINKRRESLSKSELIELQNLERLGWTLDNNGRATHVNVNKAVAREFMNTYKVSNIHGHISAIDETQSVSIVTLEPGDIIWRHGHLEEEQLFHKFAKKGRDIGPTYFMPYPGDIGDTGMSTTRPDLIKYEVKKQTQVLQSTPSYNQGRGTQYFSPDLFRNSEIVGVEERN